MIPVAYHEAAERELLEAVGYLELQSSGLGRRFFGEVRRVEELIARFPESGREALPGIRRHELRRFRYALIYAIEHGRLLVLAVAHCSRRPGYWIDRSTA